MSCSSFSSLEDILGSRRDVRWYQSREHLASHQKPISFLSSLLHRGSEMSLGRETVEEIRQYIRENCANVFGKKFWECRTIAYTQFSTKSDKFEPRFFVISKFRVFILHGKTPVHLKVDKKFNLLSLRSIQVVSANKELCLSWEDRAGRGVVKASIKCEERDTMELARELLAALKHYFPDIGPSLPNLIAIAPNQLVGDFAGLPVSTPKLLCNNFRRSYVAMCDYYDQRYKDEVVWDFEHIYFTHDIHEIRLEDFVHLPVKDQVTILACVQFSEYFTGISIDGTKLVAEHIDVLLHIARRSHSLRTLKLANCSLPRDFVAHFSTAVSGNVHIPLETIDFSGNHLDDRKGFQLLSSVLPKLSTLRSIVFSNCGLSEKCVSALASGLNSGYTMENSGRKLEPRSLVLSGNVLKDEVSELVNFISICTSLRVLDLSGTQVLLDRLWNYLKLGGLQLEVLRLAGCSTGKKSKECANMVKELFTCMVNLKEVDFAGTPLGAELLQAFLTGLTNNAQLKDVAVNLNGVCDRASAPVLEKLLVECPIGSLALRDSSFEHEVLAVVTSLRKMKSLTTLDIGGSVFYSLKNNRKQTATYAHVLDEIVRLMNDSSLKELILSDCRLGDSMNVILNALGVSKLSVLDISNNDMSNTNARLLSKALQLNHCLQKLFIDRNQITAEGFVELANALKLNRTLQALPTPLIDVAEALGKPDRARVLTAIADIERFLERNRSQHSRNEELRQKVIHKLNNRSDKYEINNSDYKRIIFFEVVKIISNFGSESPINVSVDGVVEAILSHMHALSLQNEEKTLARLKQALTEHNIEVVESVDAPNPVQDEFLRKSVRQLVENHLTEMSWATVFMKADRFLTANKALRLRGSFSNGAIDSSVHGGFAKPSHRPASILHDSGSPSRAPSTDDVSGSPSVPLVHLAKTRPKPARQLRNAPKDQNGNATGESPPPSSSHIAMAMNNSTTSHISQSSSSGDSTGSPSHRRALLPPASPHHGAADETPPPVPRRTNVPPKLPPKPDSPARSPSQRLATSGGGGDSDVDRF